MEAALGGVVVQRRLDLRILDGLAGLERPEVAVRLDRSSEVDVQVEERRAVASVRPDLLQRSQQLLLGLGPAVGRQRYLLGGFDLDGPVLLEPPGSACR